MAASGTAAASSRANSSTRPPGPPTCRASCRTTRFSGAATAGGRIPRCEGYVLGAGPRRQRADRLPESRHRRRSPRDRIARPPSFPAASGPRSGASGSRASFDWSSRAVRDRPPYPPSPLIKEVRWAPRDQIRRAAKGSDNWPMTWADDGPLYTAYGDGNGFEPPIPDRLSLGFARVEGGPADFVGVNIRSPTVEQTGSGAAGRKASGLVSVDGVLYLWTRNAGPSRLARSSDHGRTWTWADWGFATGFACPTFLNFGRDYAGDTRRLRLHLFPRRCHGVRPRRSDDPRPRAEGPDHGARRLRVLRRARPDRRPDLDSRPRPPRCRVHARGAVLSIGDQL